jgi:hypothetical protein
MLLKTDQTKCYNESGQDVPCAGSGQDGETNRVQSNPETRFEVRGGVVADRATGLCWSQNASPATWPMSWAEAFEYVAQLNQSGHLKIDDWRLPSRRELFSLISHQHINQALPSGHPFTNVFPGYYWTASECRRLADQAWYIHLGGGRIYRGMKKNFYMVWPVSGPQADDEKMSDRFVIQNSTACDRLTKLVWLRTSGEMQRPVKWEKALEAIVALNEKNAGGYADWRLPNIRELESLVDLNRHSPALAPDHPFEHIAEGYWSATTSVYEKRYAWVFYPRDGAIGVGYKPLPEFYAWVVRCDAHGATSAGQFYENCDEDGVGLR